MSLVSRKDLEDLLGAVRDLYACPSLAAYPAAALAACRVVPADQVGYNEVNPRLGRLIDFASDDTQQEIERYAPAFQQHMAEHPLIGHVQRTGDGSAAKISDFLTRSQLHRLPLYNEFFCHLRAEYQMAVCPVAGPALVIGIALNRSRRDFSERDRQVLNLLRPHLVQAYRNLEALDRAREQLALADGALACVEEGVVCCGGDGRVHFRSDRARQFLDSYFGPGDRGGGLPESLRRWVAHQELRLADPAAAAAAVAGAGRPLVVEGAEGRRLVVRRVPAAVSPDPGGVVLVLEEQRPPASPASPAALRGLGLSAREAEVLFWVAEGKTNPEIALILSISARTVQKHLEHVFQKLCVETRLAAALRAREALRRATA